MARSARGRAATTTNVPLVYRPNPSPLGLIRKGDMQARGHIFKARAESPKERKRAADGMRVLIISSASIKTRPVSYVTMTIPGRRFTVNRKRCNGHAP